MSDVSVTGSSNFSHGLLEGKGGRDGASPNHLQTEQAVGCTEPAC